MKNLWTFGCSYTGEYYPIDDPDHVTAYDKYKKWRGGNLPDVWPTILANKLGMQIQNKGLGGDSNYAIFNQFINICEQVKEGDILIFGWTNIIRFQAANNYRDIFNQILPCDSDFKLVTGLSTKTIEEIFVNRTNPMWVREIYSWIKFINLFCDKIGANVFHWTSDERLFTKNSDVVIDNRFIVARDEDYVEKHGHSLFGFLHWPTNYEGKEISRISEETNGEVNDGHLGEFGHKFQAEFFYDYIIKNKDVRFI